MDIRRFQYKKKIVYKWQRVNYFFAIIKIIILSKESIFCEELELGKLYQLMVFETSFDRFFFPLRWPMCGVLKKKSSPVRS